MAENSKIEWTHHTFNPWIGCSKVSAGCKNCYAESDMDIRRGRVKWGVNGTRSVTSYMYWRKVFSWENEAKHSGIRKRVFCSSLADVFEDWDGQVVDSKNQPLWWHPRRIDVDGIPTFSHNNEDSVVDSHNGLTVSGLTYISEFEPLTLNIIRKHLFEVIIPKTPHLDWLLLTKRPENISKMIPYGWNHVKQENVWFGTSVENMETVGGLTQGRVVELFKMRNTAKYLFLSCEPLIGEILFAGKQRLVDWVIVGGESGRNKRPFKSDWARSIRDECKLAGTAFFMKQIDKVQPIPDDLMIREFP